jgi:hypothetical protein
LFIASNKIANKIIDLLANMHISSNQWRFSIPEHILDQHMGIIANAKNFAEGFEYQMNLRGIEVPERLMVVSREYKEYITNDMELVNDGFQN